MEVVVVCVCERQMEVGLHNKSTCLKRRVDGIPVLFHHRGPV